MSLTRSSRTQELLKRLEDPQLGMSEPSLPTTATRSSRTDELLANARTTLSFISDLAPLVPVPVLYNIFTAARDLVDVAVVSIINSYKHHAA